MNLHEFARILLEMPDDEEIGLDIRIMERNEGSPPDTPERAVEAKLFFTLPLAADGDILNKKMLTAGLLDQQDVN